MPDVESYTDDLKATWASMTSDDGGEQQDAETEAEDAPADADEAAEERAEATPDEQAAEAAEGDGDASEQQDTDAQSTDDDPPAATVQAPQHWPNEDKEFFAALPDDATRERVLSLQRGIERRADERFNAAAQARKVEAELSEVFKPLDEELALSGMSRIDAVRRLVAVEAQIRRDPAAGLEWLAQQYGARNAGSESARDMVRRVAAALKVEIGGQQQPGNAEAPDPRDARIKSLENWIAQQETSAQEAQRLQLQQAVTAADTSIRAFSEAKDANGRQAHPHFEAVRPTMGALIQAASQSGETLSLEDAYQRAVWARPDLRETLLAAQKAEAARQAATASKAAVAKSKQALTPKTSSVPIPPTSDADLPQKDLLKKVWRETTPNGAGART